MEAPVLVDAYTVFLLPGSSLVSLHPIAFVYAWYFLRAHPQFSYLLKSSLSDLIYSHSFSDNLCASDSPICVFTQISFLTPHS